MEVENEVSEVVDDVEIEGVTVIAVKAAKKLGRPPKNASQSASVECVKVMNEEVPSQSKRLRLSDVSSSGNEEEKQSVSDKVEDEVNEEEMRLAINNPDSFGLDNPSWVSFTREFPSAKKYLKVVTDFLDVHKSQVEILNINESLVKYFDDKHAEMVPNPDGKTFSHRYAPSTLRSMFSMFKGFWLHTGRGDLSTQLLIIESNLDKWDKLHTVTKAKTFHKIEMSRFWDLQDDERTILLKAFSVVALSFAARGVEVFDLSYSALERGTLSGGEVVYFVHYRRSKATGSATSEGDFAIVRGEREIVIIERYLACFKAPSDRLPESRLFRKLTTRDGVVCATMCVIGHNTAAKFSKDVASLLGYANFNRYTGHCWRGTAITWAAEAGLSLAQIKSMSDHKSDTVVQGYIAKTVHMKTITSAAISIAKPVHAPPVDFDHHSPDGSPAKRRQQSYNYVNITVNGTVHGALQFNPLGPDEDPAV
eukprot:gene26684-33306_t